MSKRFLTFYGHHQDFRHYNESIKDWEHTPVLITIPWSSMKYFVQTPKNMDCTTVFLRNGTSFLAHKPWPEIQAEFEEWEASRG